MEKRHLTAHIECNNSGFYTVYLIEDLPFGCFGEGFSAKEAKEDFLRVFDGMRRKHQERTGENVEAEFSFVYDASAFLQEYKGLITLAGLAKITGINKAQLSQYVCGRRHPSPKTQERIKMGVLQFAQELSQAMA